MTDEPKIEFRELKGEEAEQFLSLLGIDPDKIAGTSTRSPLKRAIDKVPEHNAFQRLIRNIMSFTPFALKKDFYLLQEITQDVLDHAKELKAEHSRTHPLEYFAASIGIESVQMDHSHENGECVKTFNVTMDIDKAKEGWESCGYRFEKIQAEGTKDFDPR